MTSNIPAFWLVQWFSLSICRGSESFTLGNKAGGQFCSFQSFSLPSAGGRWDGTAENSAAPEHGAHWCMHDLCPSDPESENGRVLVCPRDEASAILFQFQVAKEQSHRKPSSPGPLPPSPAVARGFSLHHLAAHPTLLHAVSPSGPVLPSLLFFPPSVYSSYLKICSLMPSPLLHRVSGSFPSF